MPPVLFRAAQRIWWRARGTRGPYTFEGCYPTLADVPCPPPKGAVLHGRPSNSTPKFDARAGAMLPLVISLTPGPVTVIDFGGGLCDGLRRIQAHCPTRVVDVSYVLVETPAICAVLRGQAAAGVIITEDIPAQIAGPVVVNARGSLQYIDDWRGTLQRLAALKAAHFIVSYTPFTDEQTYARLQTNLLQRIGCWVFNRAEFVSAMAELGYREVFRAQYELPDITHKGEPGPSAFGSIVFRP